MENPPEAEVTDDFMADTYELSGEPDPSVDVDLTVMNSNMVYAEVYNMMMYPEDYIGKTVKMEGTCACYHDEETGKYYFACLIADATACCSQGIEFVLTDDYSCPDDYPEIGKEIFVTGELLFMRKTAISSALSLMQACSQRRLLHASGSIDNGTGA